MRMQKKFPSCPGCYLYKNNKGKIIYVGKAKNLKKRINSYFNTKNYDIKTSTLIKKIKNVEIIVTDNEKEALILENNLIKQFKPKYNIRLKDAKSYAYLEITKEEYPRLIISRSRKKKQNHFGPFVSSKERDHIHTLLKKTFKLKTCRKMPKKPCLRHHINICSAPCIGNITKKDYNNNIGKVKQVLKGETKNLIEKIKEEMKQKSDNKDFEKAIILREELKSLDYLQKRQKMERRKEYNEDVINYKIVGGKVYMLVFNIHKGTLAQKHEYSFEYTPGFFEQFIFNYYNKNKLPKEVIVPEKVSIAVKQYYKKAKFIVPRKKAKKELLKLAEKNIEESFFKFELKLQNLKELLKLEKTPRVIECFDVSHLSGTLSTGSMVRFTNAKPDKANYRRFKLRGDYGIDDARSIAEIVKRRYKRVIADKKELPDLVIIDGGKPQLNAAKTELKNLNINIPIIGIAKKKEEIFLPGLSAGILFDKTSKGLLLIRELRDEAHRFAIKYNKLLRTKRLEI